MRAEEDRARKGTANYWILSKAKLNRTSMTLWAL